MRVRSLKSIYGPTNYTAALEFFEATSTDREVNSSVSAKAIGFLRHLESFEFYFLLTMMIEIFDRIEILNKELQKTNLCIIDSHRKVKAVKSNLECSRDSKFEIIWEKATTGAKDLELEEPKLQRSRRTPKRLENTDASKPHNFATPKDYYRKIYCEIFDTVVTSLNERFNSNTTEFLDELEAFAVGTGGSIEKIVEFYGDDIDQELLLRNRDDFVNMTANQSVILDSIKDVLTFMKENSWCAGLVPEYFKFTKLLLTIPNSTCSSERSFSALRRLKTYLRSTMLQDRLNNIAILHVHWPLTEALDLQDLINDFIKKNQKRAVTFARINKEN